MLQNSWMAIGKDQKTGWACRCWRTVSYTLRCPGADPRVAPRFWFVALIDFAIHITVDRAKGIFASQFGVTLE